jgi:triosephosphate isomerase
MRPSAGRWSGGWARPGAACGLLAVAEVGGALVGGASLAAADFLRIASCARGRIAGGAARG